MDDIAKDWKAEISMGTWRYLAKKLGYTTKWARLKYQEIEEQSRELSAIELEELWGKVVTEIRPFGTQALLKQHGRLTGFKDGKACVEIASEPLLKMVKLKRQNISTAFYRVGNFAANVELKSRISKH